MQEENRPIKLDRSSQSLRAAMGVSSVHSPRWGPAWWPHGTGTQGVMTPMGQIMGGRVRLGCGALGLSPRPVHPSWPRGQGQAQGQGWSPNTKPPKADSVGPAGACGSCVLIGSSTHLVGVGAVSHSGFANCGGRGETSREESATSSIHQAQVRGGAGGHGTLAASTVTEKPLLSTPPRTRFQCVGEGTHGHALPGSQSLAPPSEFKARGPGPAPPAQGRPVGTH